MNKSVLPSQLESMKAKIQERRKALEQIRSFNVRRLQTDIKRISKQEVEFTHKLLEEIIPVKITWNENATKQFKEMLPFTVEFTVSKKEEDNKEDTELSEELKKEDKPSL